jgi:polyisoprenoid-binding protein YceI
MQGGNPTMKHSVIIIALLIAMTVGSFAQTQWKVDTYHSNVKFSVSHLVISDVEGSFKVYSGSLISSGGDFQDASIDFSVDVNSIDTDNEMRDKHLRSDDFFNAEKFPAMTFESVSWKSTNGRDFILEGNLTIRDVTRPVVFNVVLGGSTKDGYGNTKAGFKATATINRLDFGLKWNAVTEAGAAVVGRDVAITLNLELVQEKTS